MKCSKFDKNIYLCLKEELPQQVKHEISIHLRKCSACKEKLALFSGLLKETGEELHKLKPTLPPPPFTQYHKEKSILRRNLIPVFTILAAVLILFIFFYVFKNEQNFVRETKQFSSVSRIIKSQPSEKSVIMTAVKHSSTISGKSNEKSRLEMADVLSIKEPVPKSASLVLLTEDPNVTIIWDLNIYE